MTSLQEEDGCVTGVQYKDKETGDIKVSSGGSVVNAQLSLQLHLMERNGVFHALYNELYPVGNSCSADRGGWRLFLQIQKESGLWEGSRLLTLCWMPDEGSMDNTNLFDCNSSSML